MSWETYFKHHASRKPLPFFLKAVEVAEERALRKFAVDLGSGAGIESLELLRRGWRVHAIDGQELALKMLAARVPSEAVNNISYELSAFEEIQSIPRCDFFYTYHSFPFCKKESSAGLWQAVVDSINPGGVFAGTFFGLDDEWVESEKVTGTSLKQLDEMFTGFEVLHKKEINEMAGTAAGPQKHWHVHEVIALKK